MSVSRRWPISAPRRQESLSVQSHPSLLKWAAFVWVDLGGRWQLLQFNQQLPFHIFDLVQKVC